MRCDCRGGWGRVRCKYGHQCCINLGVDIGVVTGMVIGVVTGMDIGVVTGMVIGVVTGWLLGWLLGCLRHTGIRTEEPYVFRPSDQYSRWPSLGEGG